MGVAYAVITSLIRPPNRPSSYQAVATYFRTLSSEVGVVARRVLVSLSTTCHGRIPMIPPQFYTTTAKWQGCSDKNADVVSLQVTQA